MHDSADRLDFAPPPQPAAARAFALAILAHLLLMLALTWGVNWNNESQDVAAEAELWSSVPQQAAPKVVQAPPLPAPRPAPVVPKVEPRPAPPPPVSKAPDIAQEREKQRREEAERREEELERQKELAERKKQEELKRQEIAEQKAAEEEKKKKAEELARKAKEAKEEEAKLAALRKENLERMMKGATGAPSSTGTAVRSSGPSTSWAGKIQAAVYPNIVFRQTVSTPLRVQVEIRMSPDGTIVGKPVIRKSSGNPAWDEAVLRGLDKTGVLPRDVGGKVYSPALIGFSHGSS